MNASDRAKDRAAEAAAAMVEDGMVVGLGSGTTAAKVVEALGRRVADGGLDIVGVSTSVETEALARSVGLKLADLDAVATIDLCIDGADEVDPAFRMIKGRGGALLREKIVAAAARRWVGVVTPEKRVEVLGARMPVPVEVSPFGLRHVERRLIGLGASTTLRLGPGGGPFVTDGGHAILDCQFPGIPDPEGLHDRLKAIVGVFETGLFLGLCDRLVVGRADGVEVVERPS